MIYAFTNVLKFVISISQDNEFTVACLFATGYSVAFILFSAGIVIVSINRLLFHFIYQSVKKTKYICHQCDPKRDFHFMLKPFPSYNKNPGSANFLSDDWQKSLRHASFVFHQWAKSMWKSSQLLGKIVVWSTGVRKPGNIWLGELAAVIWLRNC